MPDRPAPTAGAARRVDLTICCAAACRVVATEPVLVRVAGTVRPVLMCDEHAETYLGLVRR
jgi:hypothetical protein